MTAREQKDIRSYCALLLKEYGIFISPDDPVIPALYIIYRHTQSTHDNNKLLASQIREALSKSNPREFHFHHPGEAWKFQLAAAFKWAIGGFAILIFISIGSWHWSKANDVKAAKAILQASGNMGILFQRVQKNNKGAFFIDFTAAAGDSIRHFMEYEKVNKKTIRIYLGKEPDTIDK